KIVAAETRTLLEDLYAPYRPKRRTRATIAREKGLEPLALILREQRPSGSPTAEATPFVTGVTGEVPDVAAALAGARDLVAAQLEQLAGVRPSSPFAGELRLAVADAFVRLLAPTVETDVRAELKREADVAAVDVFAHNLRGLLLAPPLGARSVLGVDPGIR